MDAWNPEQYERFKDERSRPFFDLLALVAPAPGGRVVDLGCGTGALTRHLHQHTQARETLGLDFSEAMLEGAQAHAGGGLTFARADIRDFADTDPGGWDVLFSNAALQWVGHQRALLTSLAKKVAPGGQLAIQVPANHDHPSHLLAHALAREEPYFSAMNGYVRGKPVLEPEEYAELLFRVGAKEQHVRLQVYGHTLPSREAVLEWVKGTLLTDYEARLPAGLFAQYIETYRARLTAALADEKPYFYPFKRLLMWARL